MANDEVHGGTVQCKDARDLIYVTRGGAGRVLSLGGLQRMGWALRRAPDARQVMKLLQQWTLIGLALFALCPRADSQEYPTHSVCPRESSDRCPAHLCVVPQPAAGAE